MRERDESRHLAVGAGAPSDPDVPAEPDVPDPPDVPGDPDPDESSAPGGNGHGEAGTDGAAAGPRTAGDVVQAVTEFLDDLVDDPTFAHDSGRTDPSPPQP